MRDPRKYAVEDEVEVEWWLPGLGRWKLSLCSLLGESKGAGQEVARRRESESEGVKRAKGRIGGRCKRSVYCRHSE